MKYWDSWGYQWTRHPQTQSDPGENEQTFRTKTGLGPDEVRGKIVLDVGCGTGRFMEVVRRWGASEIGGIEPSAARKVAEQNIGDPNSMWVSGCSLFDVEEISYGHQWDLVYSIGVLHHTPDPAAAFRAIARLVKPGGRLCVWVYGPMGRWARVSDLYRKITTRLPWGLLHALCYFAVPWAWMHRVCPPVWALLPCSLHPDWRVRVLDTFDWYSPWHRSYHTQAEVMAWFLDAGFQWVEALKFPVSVRGIAPVPVVKAPEPPLPPDVGHGLDLCRGTVQRPLPGRPCACEVCQAADAVRSGGRG